MNARKKSRQSSDIVGALDVIGEQPEYEPGTPGSVTLDLTPGHYVVMCNIAAHYKAGMYADFYVLD